MMMGKKVMLDKRIIAVLLLLICSPAFSATYPPCKSALSLVQSFSSEDFENLYRYIIGTVGARDIPLKELQSIAVAAKKDPEKYFDIPDNGTVTRGQIIEALRKIKQIAQPFWNSALFSQLEEVLSGLIESKSFNFSQRKTEEEEALHFFSAISELSLPLEKMTKIYPTIDGVFLEFSNGHNSKWNFKNRAFEATPISDHKVVATAADVVITFHDDYLVRHKLSGRSEKILSCEGRDPPGTGKAWRCEFSIDGIGISADGKFVVGSTRDGIFTWEENVGQKGPFRPWEKLGYSSDLFVCPRVFFHKEQQVLLLSRSLDIPSILWNPRNPDYAEAVGIGAWAQGLTAAQIAVTTQVVWVGENKDCLNIWSLPDFSKKEHFCSTNIKRVALSNNGNWIGIQPKLSSDTVSLFSSSPFQKQRDFKFDLPIGDFSFSSDGEYLIAVSNLGKLYSINIKRALKEPME